MQKYLNPFALMALLIVALASCGGAGLDGNTNSGDYNPTGAILAHGAINQSLMPNIVSGNV
ncbi:MAG: hypothetical protein K2X37_09440, partial [Chitinophagaceae bacterium]|nr:hypothetical protein [Chitinophagaceae bacterium]